MLDAIRLAHLMESRRSACNAAADEGQPPAERARDREALAASRALLEAAARADAAAPPEALRRLARARPPTVADRLKCYRPLVLAAGRCPAPTAQRGRPARQG